MAIPGIGGFKAPPGPLDIFSALAQQPQPSALEQLYHTALAPGQLAPALGPTLLKGGLSALLSRQGKGRSKGGSKALLDMLSSWLGGTGGTL